MTAVAPTIPLPRDGRTKVSRGVPRGRCAFLVGQPLQIRLIPSPRRLLLGGGRGFPRDITAIAFVGTVGLSSFGGTSPKGMVTEARRAGNADAVYIETSDTTGTLTPRGFHLSVQCPPAPRSGTLKTLAGNTTAVVFVPGGISSASVGLAIGQANAASSSSPSFRTSRPGRSPFT